MMHGTINIKYKVVTFDFEISRIRRSSGTHPFTSFDVTELKFFDQLYKKYNMQFLCLSELFWQSIKRLNDNKIRREVKGKDFCVRPMKACRGSRSVTPLILNFGSWLRWVVNYTLRPLYFQKRITLPLEWESGWVRKFWIKCKVDK